MLEHEVKEKTDAYKLAPGTDYIDLADCPELLRQ